jgi:hypothetical protein
VLRADPAKDEIRQSDDAPGSRESVLLSHSSQQVVAEVVLATALYAFRVWRLSADRLALSHVEIERAELTPA